MIHYRHDKTRQRPLPAPTPTRLLAEINTALSRTGMSPSTFGRAAVNDPGFVTALRNGRSLRADTIDRVRAFLGRMAEQAA